MVGVFCEVGVDEASVLFTDYVSNTAQQHILTQEIWEHNATTPCLNAVYCEAIAF